MESIKNELVFMEMDTLVMIAKEAVELSEPWHNSSEAQDLAPVALETQRRKKNIANDAAGKSKVDRSTKSWSMWDGTQTPDTNNAALLFEIIVAEVSGNTPGTHVHGGTRQRCDPE